MPSTVAEIEFLANLPLYQTEKPYLCLLSPDLKIDPDEVRVDNLEFERHNGIPVEDMREHPELHLDACGFRYIQHQSELTEFTKPSHVDAYKRETERWLEKHFSAAKVVTYELRLRKNEEFRRKQFDLNEKLLLEGPAKGAHNGKSSSGARATSASLTPKMSPTTLDPTSFVDICHQRISQAFSGPDTESGYLSMYRGP